MSTLLLVEGQDEVVITKLILATIDPSFEEKIEVQSGEGSGMIAFAKAAVKSSDFERNAKLAILVDAEEDRKKTESTWAALMADFKAQKPDHEFLALVLPIDADQGSIETVFLKSLNAETNQAARCAFDFSSCLGDNAVQATKAQKDKLTLTSYINANVKKPYSRIGKALEHDAQALFDFNHEAFKPLTEFLRKLL